MAINMSATLLAGLFGQQGQNALMLPFGNAAPVASAGDAVVAFRRVTKAGEEEKGLARERKDTVTLTALAPRAVAEREAGTCTTARRAPGA